MHRKKAALCLAAALSLTQVSPAMASGSDEGGGKSCKAKDAAVAGAVLGALIGGLASKKTGRGLAIGGTLGAAVASIGCVAVNSRVTRQRSNDQVLQDGRSRLGAVTQPTLLSYTSATARPSYQLGQQITIQDSMVVALPANAPATPIREVFEITTPDGDTKTFTKPVGDSGGELNNELTFTLPNAMKRGNYQVRSRLQVADQDIGQARTSFLVV